MAVNYTQTDTNGACTVAAYCSALSVGGAGTFIKAASNGGTAGSVELTLSGEGAFTDTIYLIFEITPSEATDWNAGTWTIRLFVQTANADIDWTQVHICRVNSSCTNQETVGSNAAVGINLGTGGAKTTTVSGSAQTPSAGDKILVICAFTDTSAHGNETWGIIPSQNIDSPFSEAVIQSLDINIRGQSTVNFNTYRSRELGINNNGQSNVNFDLDVSSPQTTVELDIGIAGLSVVNLGLNRIISLSTLISGQSSVIFDLNKLISPSILISGQSSVIFDSNITRNLDVLINGNSVAEFSLDLTIDLSCRIVSISQVGSELDLGVSPTLMDCRIIGQSNVFNILNLEKYLSCNIGSLSNFNGDIETSTESNYDLDININGISQVQYDLTVTSPVGFSSPFPFIFKIIGSQHVMLRRSFSSPFPFIFNTIGTQHVAIVVQSLSCNIEGSSLLSSSLYRTRSLDCRITGTSSFNSSINLIKSLDCHIDSSSNCNILLNSFIGCAFLSKSASTLNLNLTKSAFLRFQCNGISSLNCDPDIQGTENLDCNILGSARFSCSLSANKPIFLDVVGQSNLNCSFNRIRRMDVLCTGQSDFNVSLYKIIDINSNINGQSTLSGSLYANKILRLNTSGVGNLSCQLSVDHVPQGMSCRLFAHSSINMELDSYPDIQAIFEVVRYITTLNTEILHR